MKSKTARIDGTGPLFYTSFVFMLSGAFLDNLRGPLIAVLRDQFALSYSYASNVVVLGLIASVTAMLFMGRALARWGFGGVSAIACLICVLGVLYSFFCSTFEQALVFFFVAGICVTCFGTLSNIAMAASCPQASLGKLYGLLHALYGVGSGLATLAVGELPKGGLWQYTLVPPMIVSFVFLGVWAAFPKSFETKSLTLEKPPDNLGKHADLAATMIVLSFSFYVLAEVTTSTWLPSYVVSSANLNPRKASMVGFAFFTMMGFSRLTLFFVPEIKKKERVILIFGVLGFMVFTLGIILKNGYLISLVGIVGPIFPLLMSIVRNQFAHLWQSLMIRIMTSIQLALAINHFVVGHLADLWGIETAFSIVIVYFVLWLLCTGFLFRLLRRV